MDQPPFAEYPRPESHLQSSRGPGVYFDAFGEAWNVVRKDLGLWMAATVAFFVITYAVTLPLTPIFISAMAESQNGPTTSFFLQLGAFYLLLGVLGVTAYNIMLTGMIGVGVRKLQGEYVHVGMIFEPFRRFGTMVGVCALNSLILVAAYVACFLPYLFFYPVLMLMPTVAWLKGVGPVESLSITFEACRRHWLGLLALSIVLWFMVVFSAFLCLVPVLLTFPILCVTLAIHYRAFFEEPAPTPVAPVYDPSIFR